MHALFGRVGRMPPGEPPVGYHGEVAAIALQQEH
jgi:hypothetical protein